MKRSLPIVGGSVAGLLVVLLWVCIAYFTGYEIGLCAWIAGGCVGWAFSTLQVGGGVRAGTCCAVIAVVWILLGKTMAVAVSVNGFKKNLEENYRLEKAIAPEYAKATTPEEQRAFMVNYGYTYAETPEAVTDEELEGFKQAEGHRLIAVDRGLSYDDWFETDSLQSIVESSARIGIFDLALGLLGVITAFKLGAEKVGSRRPKAPPPSGTESAIAEPE